MKSKNTPSKFYYVKGLMYRELYLGRRSYIPTFCIFLAFVFLLFLMLLSMEHGNLANMSVTDFEITKSMIRLGCIFPPTMLICMTATFMVDLAPTELSVNWRRFQCASPVSEAKYMGVKFFTMFLLLIFDIVLSGISALLLTTMQGKPLTFTEFSMMVMTALFIALGTTIMTVLIFLFRSLPVAVGVTFVGMYATAFLFMWKTGLFEVYGDEASALFSELGAKASSFCENLLPFSPLVLLAISLIGWGLTTCILKRRER